MGRGRESVSESWRETKGARREGRDAGKREERVGVRGKRDGEARARKMGQEGGQDRGGTEESQCGVERKGPGSPGRKQYLLETAAPDTVLPAPICTLGVQTGGAVEQEVTGSGAGQWGR